MAGADSDVSETGAMLYNLDKSFATIKDHMDTSPDTSKLRRILVVDDEPNVVNAVTRELTNPPLGHYQYEVEGFTDPRLALERAAAQAFDLVISDYRMPGMDGLAFLKALAKIQPDCAVIVLSARTDMDALIKMVNETHLFRFIPKPWHDYFLKGSISQSLDYYGALLEHRRLANLVREHNIQIPPLLGGADLILVVGGDESALKAIAWDLTHHSKIDSLVSEMRSEIFQKPPTTLQEEEISVQVSTSPLQALKMADEAPYSCIITTYRLPQMDGLQLLQAFAEKQPDCARLILRGDMSMDELVSVIDLAYISGIITNPSNEFEMKTIVAQALARRRMLIENRMLSDMLHAV